MAMTKLFRLFRLLPCAVLVSGCALHDGPARSLIPTSGENALPVSLGGDVERAMSSLAEGTLRALGQDEDGGDLGVVGTFPEYQRAQLPATTRIFLVAGGAADARPVQEILVQRNFWRAQGYTDAEIACYHVRPTREDFEKDRARFEALAPETSGFYLAAPHVLFKHLHEIAAALPTAIYLYVAAPGFAPRAGSPEEQALAREYPDFAGSYRLGLRGGPSGHMNERMRLEALRDGIDAHYLLCTDRFLAQALAALPATCEKFVVLNGDHSGGFLSTPSGDNGALREVPGMTVIASARHDRQAIGDGGELSWFGTAFHEVVSAGTGKVEARSWRRIANDVMVAVDRMEAGGGIDQSLRSRPVFYSALERESGPTAQVSATEAAGPAAEEPPAALIPTSGEAAASEEEKARRPGSGAVGLGMKRPGMGR